MYRSIFFKINFKKYPHEISAGEAQRASLIRSLYPNPLLLLMNHFECRYWTQGKVQVNLKTILKKIILVQ